MFSLLNNGLVGVTLLSHLFRPCRVSFKPWGFKLDDSWLPSGNIEGCCNEALLVSRLFTTCSGLISVGHGLSYISFRRVCKGLLVFGATERITIPLELVTTTIWLA